MRRLSPCSAVALALIAGLHFGPGCGSDEAPAGDPDDTPDASADGAAGDAAPVYDVRVDGDVRTLLFLRDDVELLRFDPDALSLGTVGAIDDAWNYDPHGFLVAGGPEPAGLTWQSAESWEVTTEGDTTTITLGYPDGTTADVAITRGEDDASRWRLELVPRSGAERVAYVRLRPRVSSTEGFYGLGEYFDHVNHRGLVRSMQLELDLATESSYNEAHVPVPFVTGTTGWGLFTETRYPATFDVASQEDDLLDVIVATGSASAEGLVFHVFLAEHPLDVTKQYYEVTGYPKKPARWALGPWVWRDENRDQAEVESDLGIMRDLDLATTAIWIDRPYATAVNSFDFDPARFTDPGRMIALAHDLGFRVALWHTPYVGEKAADPATAALVAEATSGGYYPPTASFTFNNWGNPVDLTNPSAYTWWQGLVRRYTDMGIEGFKLDYAEDVTVGYQSSRTVWQFADGSDERTMHARFTELYHQVYAETLPDDGGFLLCRAGTWGDQTQASVIWPGDLDASFARHGDTVADPGGSYVAVGGLPASIVAGSSLGPSGYPLFGADTGGYRHSPPDEETFRRWFEQTALSTVMQIGTSTNDVAWEWEQKGWSAETLEDYREYTRLHLRLWPYVWTYLEQLYTDGRPIQRALGLAYPELGLHPDDIYLIGDALLVAPVVDPGATSREVMLPPGTWVDWWTGEALDGDRTVTVQAPLGTLPLFLRAGALVPMLRPTIDAMAPTTDPGRVDSYATTPGPLFVRTTLAGDATEFDVFDGTHIQGAPSDAETTFRIEPGREFTDGAVLEIIGFGSAPSSVTVNGSQAPEGDRAALTGADAAWTFETAAGGTLFIRVPAGTAEVSVAR